MQKSLKVQGMNGAPDGTTIETDSAHPSQQSWQSRVKKALGPVGIALVVIAKFFAKVKFFILPALKFLPLLLKSGGTMLLMIWVYTQLWGWKFAVGFVVLLLRFAWRLRIAHEDCRRAPVRRDRVARDIGFERGRRTR